MNPQHSKLALLKNKEFELPKMKSITLHNFYGCRLKKHQSPEPKIPKLQQLTFQSTLIVKRIQPRCRQRKVQMRTISLHKINNVVQEHSTQYFLNQSLDIKGWSQKSVMELFDI
ncbi:unnamed protein product [Paramecium sonneborni]|uniref:Uncharacterized protein n=1 Tax=Paramecium sonneborni TaxID=65129 RepID=A0A8S1M2I4_9CILI|nr:unnamed protein product [Paramecium sonneborni]